MKRKFMKCLSMMLVLSLCLSSMPATSVEAKIVSKPKLSEKSITMTVGKKKTIKLKKATKLNKKKIKKVKWSVTKKGIVTLTPNGKYKQNCKITAKKAGSTTVKLKYNGKTYKCKIVVKSTNKKDSTTENKSDSTTENKSDSTTENKSDSTTENKTESTTENKSNNDSTETKTESTTENKPNEDITTEKPTEDDPKDEDPTNKDCSHTWSSYTITKPATCTEAGEQVKVCLSCFTKVTEEIAMTDHEFSDYKVVKASTCTDCGEETRSCNNCDTTESRIIKATGHSFGDYTVTKHATCSEAGEETRSCNNKNCTETESRSIEKLNHSETYGGLSTCHKKCGECGITLENGTYHQYSDTIVTAATCKKAGVLKHTCQCGYSYTEAIPISLEHTYDSNHQCTVCKVFDEDSAYSVDDISEAQDGSVMMYSYASELSDSDNTYYDVYVNSTNINNVIYNDGLKNTSLFGTKIYSKMVTSLTFINKVKSPKNCSYMFYCLGRLTPNENYTKGISINNLDYLNTSEATNMTGMFQECNLDTYRINLNTSNVTNMSYMFYSMRYSDFLSFSDIFVTSKVTNMSHMFGMSQFKHLSLSNFDTSNVTDMSRMFYCATEMGQVDFSNFDTSKVTNMSKMFENYGRNVNNVVLDLSNFDTSNVTDMSYMFKDLGYSAVGYKITLGSKFTSKSVNNIYCMFHNIGYEIYEGDIQYSSIKLGSFLQDRSNLTDTSKMTMFDSNGVIRIYKADLTEDVINFINEHNPEPIYY